MKNPATHINRDAMNTFTFKVVQEGKPVKLRNGNIVEKVLATIPKSNLEEPCLHTPDWSYCWHLDGTSVTRNDYDMMESIDE